MEANRDAAKQCLSVAAQAFASNDVSKALKLAQKSFNLYPGTASQAILADATRMELNRDAAEQSLIIATRARNDGDIAKAFKFANKSQQLCRSVVAATMIRQLNDASKQTQDEVRQARMSEIQADYDARMRELKTECDQNDQKRRVRRELHIVKTAFAAWRRARGCETPPDSAPPGDPIDMLHLYEELEALSVDESATPNEELDLAMDKHRDNQMPTRKQQSPTRVMSAALDAMCWGCAQEDSDNESVVTQSEAPQSVATSTVTIESTLHLRERRGQRGISKRELQSVLKHGSAEQDMYTGRMMHQHNGITFVTDSRSKVGITAWSEANCKGAGCNEEATCYRGFCDDCCWGCSEHNRCQASGCVERDTCVRGFCDDCCWGCSEHNRCQASGCVEHDTCVRGFCRECCYGSSSCDCVAAWGYR